MLKRKELTILISLFFFMATGSINAAILFQDDFDEMNEEIWTVVNGQWKTSEGHISSRGEEREIILQ